jgi:hypothetical protein
MQNNGEEQSNKTNTGIMSLTQNVWDLAVFCIRGFSLSWTLSQKYTEALSKTIKRNVSVFAANKESILG